MTHPTGWMYLACCLIFMLAGVWFGRMGRKSAMERAHSDGFWEADLSCRDVIRQLQGQLDDMVAERRVRSAEIGALRSALAQLERRPVAGHAVKLNNDGTVSVAVGGSVPVGTVVSSKIGSGNYA